MAAKTGPRVRSSRLARMATILMIALGIFSVLVSVAIAAIVIVLGVAMFLFEWWMVRKFRQTATSD